MTAYEPVIGLEVHAEMLTNSKMFCSCPVVELTTAAPNTAVCEVCTAQPGTLPVVNQHAVEYGIMVGLALNCAINEFNQFARKSYFYPDLPKGYQISQYEYPLASNGYLDVETSEGTKRIGITRAHIEEDTGKSTHIGSYSLVDLNRAGVPLLEIVSEPDLRNVEEVEAYARKLRAILVYLGVNHGDMSKGVLRFEANISVRPVGSDELRTRTEVKNLNSIRSLVRATRYEIARQTELYENGGKVIQQTMGFNENTGETRTQRIKETADDYRYFPEPDIPILRISREWVAEIDARLPELPDAKRTRFVEEFGLTEDQAGVLVGDKTVADYFDATLAAGGDPRSVANWITTQMFGLMNARGLDIEEVVVTPGQLVALIKMVDDGTINNNTAKDVLEMMLDSGQDPATIVEGQGLAQISDTATLEAMVDRIIEENPGQVQGYLGGKEGLMGFFVGQVMRETKGKANAALVHDLFATRFDAMKD